MSKQLLLLFACVHFLLLLLLFFVLVFFFGLVGCFMFLNKNSVKKAYLDFSKVGRPWKIENCQIMWNRCCEGKMRKQQADFKKKKKKKN